MVPKLIVLDREDRVQNGMPCSVLIVRIFYIINTMSDEFQTVQQFEKPTWCGVLALCVSVTKIQSVMQLVFTGWRPL